MSETLRSGSVSTRLQRIALLAKEYPNRAFTSVAHVIDVEWMREAHRRTRKSGATGVDGVRSSDFEEHLDRNLASLVEQLHRGTYRAPPVRRVFIPKGENKPPRPIGIPTFADKVMQRAVAMVLEAIYEQDFHPDSYGFRPGRSAHQALEELQRRPTYWTRCWVLEADIKSFFDTLDHAQLRSFLDQRVRDGVIRRMVDKWLAAGVLEQGGISHPEAGTPQGGVISPLLANIYLHHVLDEWYERDVRPRVRTSRMVRYADDFVLMFTREDDARRVMRVVGPRFERFGLQLHPDKTRLLSFDSPGRGRPRAQRERSFDFLGLTHYWARSRKGRWVVKQRTAKDRFSRGLKAFQERCRRLLHAPVRVQHLELCALLRGHYAYYGITGNGDAISSFRREAIRIWGRSLARRNRKRFAWARFAATRDRFPFPPARPSRSVCPSEPSA